MHAQTHGHTDGQRANISAQVSNEIETSYSSFRRNTDTTAYSYSLFGSHPQPALVRSTSMFIKHIRSLLWYRTLVQEPQQMNMLWGEAQHAAEDLM